MIAEKQAKLNTHMLITASVFLTIWFLGAAIVTPWLVVFYGVIGLLFLWAYRVSRRTSRKKNEALFFNDEGLRFSIELENKGFIYVRGLPLPIILFNYSTIGSGMVAYKALSLVLILMGMAFMVYYMKQWMMLAYLAFEDGLRLSNVDVPYEHIKKYQFIKKKNGKQTLEINVKDQYYRFYLSPAQEVFIREKLSA